MNRLILSLITAIILAVPVFLLFIPIESYILENFFDVLSVVDQNVWLANYREVGVESLVIALVFTLLWSIFGYASFQITDWRKSGGRETWLILMGLMSLAIIIFGYVSTYVTQDIGKYVASLFYAFNGLFVYWLASLLQSPSTVKFAPIGAKRVRRLKFLRQLLN